MQCYIQFAYLNHLFSLRFPPQNSLVVAPVFKEFYSLGESFSRVPRESSWLVVPHHMSHLTPSVPVRWCLRGWSCSFGIWTDFFMLLSLQGPPSRPLFCLSFGSGFICYTFLARLDQIWPCFEQKAVPITSRHPFSFCHHVNPWKSHAENCQIPSEIVSPPSYPQEAQHHQHPTGTKPSYLLCLCLLTHLVCNLVVSENQGGSTRGIMADQQDTSNLAMEESEDHFCSFCLGHQQGQVTDFVLMLPLL